MMQPDLREPGFYTVGVYPIVKGHPDPDGFGIDWWYASWSVFPERWDLDERSEGG